MRSFNKSFKLVLALALVMLFVSGNALAAQTLSNVTSTQVNFTVNESLTVTVTGGAITIPSNGSASNQISATVAWNLHSGGSNKISMLAYFGSTTALTGAFGGTINASQVFMSYNGGAAAACTATIIDQETRAVAGATCPGEFFIQNAQVGSTGTSTAQTYVLSIPSASSIAPDVYTGQLLISAGANV